MKHRRCLAANLSWTLAFGLSLYVQPGFAGDRPVASLLALPLAFEEAPAGFVARTPNLAIHLESNGFYARTASGDRISEVFAGANPHVALYAEEQLPGRANSLLGNDPHSWKTDAPTFRRIRAREIYPKIDLVYYGSNRQLEFDFVVEPGGNPNQIRMAFDGAADLRLEPNGDLLIAMPEGDFRQHRPIVYQVVNGVRKQIAGAFTLKGRVASFVVTGYDHRRPLTIDPALSFATYLGGGNTEFAYAIAVDASGNTYVAGETYSTDFPRLGSVKTYQGGKDIFVTKLNSAGTAILYSTLIGGSLNDSARALAIDSAGNVYLTGQTYSTNFPITSGVLRATALGAADAFVLKLNAAGNALVFSTYLGSSGNEMGTSLAVDAGSNVFVAGYTDSVAFPVTAGVAQSTHRGGFYDGWIAKLSWGGTSLLYCTYLGGSGLDIISGIAIDSSGNAFVSGQTDSIDFPVVNAYQASRAGNSDAFVAKINSTASAILYSTYLGGGSTDQAFGIAVDLTGNAYIAGSTFSSDFPTTSIAFQTAWKGAYDAFVAKINAVGNGLVYSTYLGGTGNDIATAIRVSSAGLAWIAGYTDSLNFPMQTPTQNSNHGGRDGFIAAVSPTGSALSLSTYLGGSGEDVITALAMDASSNAFVTGYTASTNLPVTPGVYQQTMIRSYDAFVAAIRQSASTPPTTLSVSPASGTGTTQNFQFKFSDASGYGNLTAADMQVQAALNGAYGCSASYNPLNGTLTLKDDSGVGLAGSAKLGSGTVLQNSQCQIGTGSSTASGTGTTLTLNLAITFKLAFVGGKTVYGRATNSGGLNSGWILLGTWSVSPTNQGPSVVGITPYSGAGMTQAFSFLFSDPNGYTDLNTVFIQITPALNAIPRCALWYTQATNTIYMLNDAGTDAFGPYTLGIPGTAQNSQCSLNLASSSMTGTGTMMTLTLAVTFKNNYQGSKITYAFAQDNAGLTTGWQRLGTWTVGATNQPPTVAGITPASGTGTSQIFNFIFSDGNGFADLSTVYGQLSPSLHKAPGCSFWYTRSTNTLFLINDASNNATGPFTVGGTGVASNGQCSIDLAASGTSTSGNTLVVSLAVTFSAGYSGPKFAYAYASDNPGLGSGWQKIGTWTVP